MSIEDAASAYLDPHCVSPRVEFLHGLIANHQQYISYGNGEDQNIIVADLHQQLESLQTAPQEQYPKIDLPVDYLQRKAEEVLTTMHTQGLIPDNYLVPLRMTLMNSLVVDEESQDAAQVGQSTDFYAKLATLVEETNESDEETQDKLLSELYKLTLSPDTLSKFAMRYEYVIKSTGINKISESDLLDLVVSSILGHEIAHLVKDFITVNNFYVLYKKGDFSTILDGFTEVTNRVLMYDAMYVTNYYEDSREQDDELNEQRINFFGTFTGIVMIPYAVTEMLGRGGELFAAEMWFANRGMVEEGRLFTNGYRNYLQRTYVHEIMPMLLKNNESLSIELIDDLVSILQATYPKQMGELFKGRNFIDWLGYYFPLPVEELKVVLNPWHNNHS